MFFKKFLWNKYLRLTKQKWHLGRISNYLINLSYFLLLRRLSSVMFYSVVAMCIDLLCFTNWKQQHWEYVTWWTRTWYHITSISLVLVVFSQLNEVSFLFKNHSVTFFFKQNSWFGDYGVVIKTSSSFNFGVWIITSQKNNQNVRFIFIQLF